MDRRWVLGTYFITSTPRKTIALWTKLAERYRNKPWIGGYDIINETNWGSNTTKPNRDAAFETMMQIAENVKIENCIRNDQVFEALLK